MFARDDKYFKNFFKIDYQLNDEEYVKMCIKQARQFFNIDAGHSEAKKAHLGDIKNTKIESPGILSDLLFDKNMPQEQK